MKILLDTHTLFWSVEEPTKLSPAASTVIADPANDRLLSAADFFWHISGPVWYTMSSDRVLPSSGTIEKAPPHASVATSLEARPHAIALRDLP